MGWGLSASAENTNSDKNTNFNQNQDYTGNSTTKNAAVLDPRWQTAYDAITSGMSPSGYTPDQQAAVDYAKGQMNPATNPVNAQTVKTNTALGANGDQLADASQYFKNQENRQSYTLGSLSAKAAAGVPGYESYLAPKDLTAQTVGTSNVDPTSGAAYIDNYADPYTRNVVDSSLASYDKNTANQLNALRAGRDAGSAFGDRANIADDQFLSNQATGRAQLESQLRDQGFTLGANLGQNDANRSLQAGTTNAANTLAASSTNAANKLNAGEFNNNLLDNRQKFDVGAAYQGDASRDSAMTNYASILKQSAGLTQQQLDNVVTSNGINTQAAQALFQSGQISQAQLQAILQAATTANGNTSTTNADGSQRTAGNQNTTSNSTTVGAKASFGG